MIWERSREVLLVQKFILYHICCASRWCQVRKCRKTQQFDWACIHLFVVLVMDSHIFILACLSVSRWLSLSVVLKCIECERIEFFSSCAMYQMIRRMPCLEKWSISFQAALLHLYAFWMRFSHRIIWVSYPLCYSLHIYKHVKFYAIPKQFEL